MKERCKAKFAKIKENILILPLFSLETLSQVVRFVPIFLLLWRSKAVRETLCRLLLLPGVISYPAFRNHSSQPSTPQDGLAVSLWWVCSSWSREARQAFLDLSF